MSGTAAVDVGLLAGSKEDDHEGRNSTNPKSAAAPDHEHVVENSDHADDDDPNNGLSPSSSWQYLSEGNLHLVFWRLVADGRGEVLKVPKRAASASATATESELRYKRKVCSAWAGRRG
jgi:hypothetical protein